MVIECPQCQAKYHYAEDRFEGKPTKRVRCVKCQETFTVANPSSIKTLSREESLDDTKGGRKRVPPEPAPAEVESIEPTRRKKPSRTPESIFAELELEKPTGKQEARPKLPAGFRLSLAVINGPDAGKVFRIDKPRVIIGRGHGDLPLNDAEASRSHAAIEVRDSLILLEDLGSTNGTFHKGKSVEEPQPLNSHSEFVIGTTTLMLIVTRES